jgi:hypothetical protein
MLPCVADQSSRAAVCTIFLYLINRGSAGDIMALRERGHKERFPTLATILLVIGILWLLTELKVIAIPVPWIPIVLILIAIGMMVNRCVKK